MRRLWAASAAIVMCLALGVPALAQEEAVAVTATQVCSGTPPTLSCDVTASDPRVTGTVAVTVGGDVSVPDRAETVMWGDSSLAGPDGDWSGHWTNVWDSQGTMHSLTVYTGDGAYEGWTYVTLQTDPSGTATGDFIGVIYQGPPPPPYGPASEK